MRYVVWALLLASTILAVNACYHRGDGPLLLADPKPKDDLPPPTGPVADNSRCHVCHINYEDETFAVSHARADVGCERCHGSSDAHCSDEDNITPPDKMYPASRINASCLVCHPAGKIDDANHKPILAGTDRKFKLCTDCHGVDHRLAYRTRRWDKVTGKLLQDDKVRMITDDVPK